MARYALTEVVLIALGGILVTALMSVYQGWWAVIPALCTLALLMFYRDPPRRPVMRADAIVAPADGRILSIEVAAPCDAGESAPLLRICIFLSVLDVHVNRSPCSATVAGVRYYPGKFLNALLREATAENEANELVLHPDPPLPGPVVVRQIAGLLARRIVCAVKEGDRLVCGDRFGMIKLGSQTQVSVPDDGCWRVRVRAGDVVRGGLTVLAERTDEAGGGVGTGSRLGRVER